MTYQPKIDDYVKWRNVEGWVYFVDHEYFTIEIAVKNKSEESYRDSPLHRKVHCLIVCHHYYWDDVEYVKHRRKEEMNYIDDYKSQPFRDTDLY